MDQNSQNVNLINNSRISLHKFCNFEIAHNKCLRQLTPWQEKSGNELKDEKKKISGNVLEPTA